MPLENPDSARASLAARVKDALLGPETGAPVIARYAKTAPAGPGVYRMIDAGGRGALCRQGAASQEARAELCAGRRAQQPHRPHDRRHGEHGVRHHLDRDRGAAARSQSDQAAQAPLQRRAARRQVVPLHPHRPRPSRAADPEASRRAEPQRRLFRPLRLGRRRRPHHQHAATRLPAQVLLRRLLREPVQALPSVSDQALQRALHRRDLRRGLWRAGR